jgi:hypothetical protein
LEAAEILNSDRKECFGKDEAEVGKWAEQQKNQQFAKQPFLEKTKSMRSTVMSSSSTSPASGSSRPPPKRARVKTGPSKGNADDQLFDEDGARKFMPEGALIYKDQFNRRWLAFSHGSSRSRSWTLHSDYGAMCMVLLWAWQVHRDHGGASCPYPWVEEGAASSSK